MFVAVVTSDNCYHFNREVSSTKALCFLTHQNLFYPGITCFVWYWTVVKKECRLYVSNPSCAHGCVVVIKSSCSELKVVSRFLKTTSKKEETALGSRGMYNLRQVVCGQARMRGATFIKFPERTMDRVSVVRRLLLPRSKYECFPFIIIVDLTYPKEILTSRLITNI